MLAFLFDDAKHITKARKTLASMLIISQICFAKSQNSDYSCYPNATETTTKNSLPPQNTEGRKEKQMI